MEVLGSLFYVRFWRASWPLSGNGVSILSLAVIQGAKPDTNKVSLTNTISFTWVFLWFFGFFLLGRFRLDVRKGFLTWRVVQHGRRTPRSDGGAVLGGFQDLAGQSHSWPDVVLAAVLLWAEGWARDLKRGLPVNVFGVVWCVDIDACMLPISMRKQDQTEASLCCHWDSNTAGGAFGFTTLSWQFLPSFCSYLLPSNHFTLPLLIRCSSLCCQSHRRYLSHAASVHCSRRGSLHWAQTSLTSTGQWCWSRQCWRADTVLIQRCSHAFAVVEQGFCRLACARSFARSTYGQI